MKRCLTVLLLFALSLCGFAQDAREKSTGATCAAFPCVVASVSLTNQGQGIPATTIFTPAASGVFRIGTYLSTTTGTNQNATWEAFVGWTDDIGVRLGGFVFALPNIATSSTLVVQMVAGQPLLYQTKLYRTLGGSGGMTYNLNVVVEQLQ